MNRREFLSSTVATMAAGTLIPRALADGAPQKSEGMNYAPQGKPNPVVKPGEFVFAAARLDHGHIYGMCNGLLEAGATLKWVYDPDPKKTEAFRAKFPQAQAARSIDEVLADPGVRLVAAAAVTSERGPFGCQVMEAGKDYFSDKAPFTTMAQLDQAKAVVARTGRKYMVYYSERLHNESAMFATDLVQKGAIGRVIQVVCLAPHRLSKASRPDWFFQREKFGAILCAKGTIELRKYLDIARDAAGDHLYIADEKGERHLSVAGKVGYRFFGEFILDCLNRTENAMTQAHAFKAAELCLRAQSMAQRVT